VSATVSSESIASHPPQPGAADTCATCGAPLAGDQRYCLECGERHVPMSSLLAAGPPPVANTGAAPGPGSAPPAATPPGGWPPAPPPGAARSNTLTVIAGVGVLLLAMGVGVLIGRAGVGTKSAAAPPVISVSTAPTSSGSGAAGGSAGEAPTFTDDWPATTSGYTVQLQTLPQAGTQTAAVEAAKTAAGAKGAKAVGALKSDDFGLPASNYVIYSGVYHSKSEAQKALAGLKKSFPGAKVIKVSPSGGAASSTTPSAPKAGGSGASGASHSHQPPTKAAEELNKVGGKSYEEKSKNLPNVVGT
jgi:hypothetical protein